MKLSFNSNIARLHYNFVKWAEEVPDMTEAFKLFIPQFQKSRDGWIYAGRNVDGGKHPQLKSPYKEIKNRRYGRQPILIASGRLIRALRGGPGWKQTISKKELTMGIDLPYASYPQDGTRNMRQRNYFLTKGGTLNKMDYAQLLQAMEGDIQKSTEALLNKTIVEMAVGK